MFIFDPSFRYNLLIPSSGGDGYYKNCLKYLPARIKNTISSKNYTAKNIEIILKLLSLFLLLHTFFLFISLIVFIKLHNLTYR